MTSPPTALACALHCFRWVLQFPVSKDCWCEQGFFFFNQMLKSFGFKRLVSVWRLCESKKDDFWTFRCRQTPSDFDLRLHFHQKTEDLHQQVLHHSAISHLKELQPEDNSSPSAIMFRIQKIPSVRQNSCGGSSGI